MRVGIGLPSAVPGVDRGGIVEWARRAEAAGFSSLGTLDRIAYGNYESLVALLGLVMLSIAIWEFGRAE